MKILRDIVFLRVTCTVRESILIPKRTFLVRFGGISGEFGPKLEPKYPRETTVETYQKGSIRYLPFPNSNQNPAISG